MSLIKEATRWVLFLAARGEPETRHILDLAFGLYCLESAGIPQANIAIYIDGNDRQIISQLVGSGTSNQYVIKTSDDFFIDQQQNSHENLVMFVTGHGSIDGIDAVKPIRPYPLLKAVKDSPNLVQAVLYLGQCHAGIFNYIGAGRSNGDTKKPDPNVIIIGATSLHESLSASTNEQLGSGPVSWIANVFLLHLFKWVSAPIDVDGDGRTTVIDSFKYAGSMANGVNKDVKMSTSHKSFDLRMKCAMAEQNHQAQQTLASGIALQAANAQYFNVMNVGHIHQESWILNAIPAQSIEF